MPQLRGRIAAAILFVKKRSMPNLEKLSEFVAQCQMKITGDENFRSGTAA